MGIDLKDPVTGIIETGAKAFEQVAGVFTENTERGAQRAADEQKALLEAYQAEFNQRTNRTWVDSIADGFNRLVRPVIVTIIISVFLIAYISPERFALISFAMSAVPNGYWALLSVIIGFYFGGRMQLKNQDFQLRQSQVNAVQALVAAKAEFRNLALEGDEPDRVVGNKAGKDVVVEEIRRGAHNGVIEAYRQAMKGDDARGQLQKVITEVKASSDKEHPGLFILDNMSAG